MAMENSQLRGLSADQAAAYTRVKAQAKVVVLKTANDIARDAKIIAHQKFSPEATGATANSISASLINGNTAEVGPTTYYAPFVEMGTSRMAAKPFMAPAAERHEAAFEDAMAQLGTEAMG